MSGPLATDARRVREAAPGEERLRERCLANPLWAKFYDGWELLGRGAYGTVIGTRHRTLGDIAVKAFEWLSPDEEIRFDQEAAALARLLHPSIVRIYGVFKDDGLYWFEMERVHGPTLKEALERRQTQGDPLRLQEAVEIAASVTEALQAAHAAGVIHRDVKPANVLLPENVSGTRPRAKLGDFGVSRLFDAARRTATGMVVGSYEYAAPELFAGKTATAASDVYSFMVLLYRLLTGNAYPYEVNGDRSPVAFMEAHTKQVALPVGLINRELPQELQDVMTLGLAKDPGSRPSWDDILAALKQVASHSPGPTPVPRARLLDPVRREIPRRSIAPRYVLGVSIVAVAAAGLVVTRGRPEESAARATEAVTPEPSSARAVQPATPAEAPDAPAQRKEPSRDVGDASDIGVDVRLEGGALKVRNLSGASASVRITAMTSAGSQHVATVSRLDPGLQHTIFLDGLTPPITGAADVLHVEVVDLSSPGTVRRYKP